MTTMANIAPSPARRAASASSNPPGVLRRATRRDLFADGDIPLIERLSPMARKIIAAANMATDPDREYAEIGLSALRGECDARNTGSVFRALHELRQSMAAQYAVLTNCGITTIFIARWGDSAAMQRRVSLFTASPRSIGPAGLAIRQDITEIVNSILSA